MKFARTDGAAGFGGGPPWLGWAVSCLLATLLAFVSLGGHNMRWSGSYSEVFKRAPLLSFGGGGGVAAAASWDSPGENDVAVGGDVDAAPAAPPGGGPGLEIVIAHRAGRSLDTPRSNLHALLNLTAVASRNATVSIYVKGPPEEAQKVQGDFAFAPGLNVTALEDVGGDTHSYLTHMLQRYDSLAPHTLFYSTADHLDDAFMRLDRLLLPQTGYLGLGAPTFCSCVRGCGFEGTLMGLRDMFHFMSKRFCHLQAGESFSHFQRNQFVVSRRRVRARPLRFWEQMLALLGPDQLPGADAGYLTSEPVKQRWNAADPLFGQVMERAWGLAFHCWNASVAAACRCAVDLPEPACHPSQCQCLDDVPGMRLRNGYFPLPLPPGGTAAA